MNAQLKFGVVAWAVLAVMGCAQNKEIIESPRQEAASIVQIGFGPNARFVTCPVSGCPRPTPKTIANTRGGSAEPAARKESASMPSPAAFMAAAASMLSLPSSAGAAAAPPAGQSASGVQVAGTMTASAQALGEQSNASVSTGSGAMEKQPSGAARASAPIADDQRKAEPKPVDAQLPSGVQKRAYVNFPEGSARLTAESKRQLDALAPMVRDAERVIIKGRTDERGDRDSNDRLALRRALAVHHYLKSAAKGSGKRFQLLAKGACCYLATNDTPEGRAANRRAEVDFVAPSKTKSTHAQRLE